MADGVRILLATRSSDKAREIHEVLGWIDGLALVSPDEIGMPASPDEQGLETYATFLDNAAAKARYFATRAGLPALSDDSGLVVDALGGAPGVHTKRFSGRTDLTGKALDEANSAFLLERLAGVPAERRTARYVCVAALFTPPGRIFASAGSVSGAIGFEPRGVGGFGYDPIFRLPSSSVTFAELSAAAKNRISHRARAFRALASLLGGSEGPEG